MTFLISPKTIKNVTFATFAHRGNALTDHIATAITQADAASSHHENHARIPGDLFFAAFTRRHLHDEDWAWLKEDS